MDQYVYAWGYAIKWPETNTRARNISYTIAQMTYCLLQAYQVAGPPQKSKDQNLCVHRIIPWQSKPWTFKLMMIR